MPVRALVHCVVWCGAWQVGVDDPWAAVPGAEQKRLLADDDVAVIVSIEVRCRRVAAGSSVEASWRKRGVHGLGWWCRTRAMWRTRWQLH